MLASVNRTRGASKSCQRRRTSSGCARIAAAETRSVHHPEEVAMHPSTNETRTELLVTTMSERITTVTRTLSSWMQHHPATLAEIEQHVLRLVKELGATLVAGLASLAAPLLPPPAFPCPCGQSARYQRQRPAHVITTLGPITIQRPYYLC